MAIAIICNYVYTNINIVILFYVSVCVCVAYIITSEYFKNTCNIYFHNYTVSRIFNLAQTLSYVFHT